MKNQKSLGNKGFSLVELIVVIAIMAILVGLLAPQFVKYVGSSRDSTDERNNAMLEETANTAIADPTVTPFAGTIIVTADTGTDNFGEVAYAGDLAAAGAPQAAFRTLIEDTIGRTAGAASVVKWPDLQSNTNYTITISVSGDGFVATSVLN